jgi:hypothetical protein
MNLNADTLLIEAMEKHNIHLSVLVAETAIWANPEVHRISIAENRTGCFFPYTRRLKKGKGEIRSTVVDGIRLDDNTYANHAIKQAIGAGRNAQGFETCHIWPKSCYDERYHTAIANLVLIPRALASLSDHSREVSQSLQYRAFELYGWYPMEERQPEKPNFYPRNWRMPEPFTQQIANAIRRRRAAIIVNAN